MPGCKRDDQIAMIVANALAVTIRPPLAARKRGDRAFDLVGVAHVNRAQFHPNDGATAWIARQLADPGGYVGREGPPLASRRGAICFEQFQPFPA